MGDFVVFSLGYSLRLITTGSGPFKLTSKLIVDAISTITSLPSTWTVPRDNSATIVDLSALERLPQKPNGDEYTIDAFIRAEVHLISSLHPEN